MALTITNTNYNGDVLDVLYAVFDTGNEVAQNAISHVKTGVKKKFSLPRISATANPFGDYTADAPIADTVTVTYAERVVEPQPMMLFLTMLPEDLDEIWPGWQSDGDFTNSTINAEVLTAILAMNQQGMGKQVAELSFQGDDTLSAGLPLNKFTGWVTSAIADANVPKVTPAGVITGANIAAIVKDFWTNIPWKFRNNPNYKMMMHSADYDLLQLANLALKEEFTGILDVAQLNVFLGQMITPLESMPKNHILGGITGVDKNTTNFFTGVIEDESNEMPRIEKFADGSKKYFIRIDMKADVNYRVSEELLLYKPA